MFFFIPIGHEDSRIHRFPVASLALVMACLAGFALTWPHCQKEEELIERGIGAIRIEVMALALRERDDSQLFRKALKETLNAQSIGEYLEPIEKAIAEWESEYSDDDAMARLKGEVKRVRAVVEGQVFRRYGLVPREPRLLAFFTSMFLHGGWMHLIFNLVFFILVGPSLEDLWGRVLFPIIYILSGLAAAVGFMIMSGPINVPMIGASGAIAGLMGAFLVSFTFTRIKVFGFIWLFVLARAFTFSMPAWAFLPLWVGEEIIQGIMQSGTTGAGSGGVAHWAHVAGFFFGVAAPFALRATSLDRKMFPVHSTKEGGGEAKASSIDLDYLHDAGYRRAMRQWEDGDWSASIDSFQALAGKYPRITGPLLDLAEAHDRNGDPRRRQEVLHQALELAAKNKDSRLIEVYEALRKDSPKVKIGPEVLLRVGMAFEREGQSAEAVDHLRRLLEQFPDHPLRIRAAMRLADMFIAQGDVRGARGYLEKFQGSSDPLWREEVERRLKALPEAPPAPEAGAPGTGRPRLDRTR
jgi:membrane associated rhomboid family serine protease